MYKVRNMATPPLNVPVSSKDESSRSVRMLLNQAQMSLVHKKLKRGSGAGLQAAPGDRLRVFSFADACEYNFELARPGKDRWDEGKVSYLSPLGSQLLGARVGERIIVSLAGRHYDFRVIEITSEKPDLLSG